MTHSRGGDGDGKGGGDGVATIWQIEAPGAAPPGPHTSMCPGIIEMQGLAAWQSRGTVGSQDWPTEIHGGGAGGVIGGGGGVSGAGDGDGGEGEGGVGDGGGAGGGDGGGVGGGEGRGA